MTAEASDGGKVYLIGAGPGDPDLLTVRARRLIDRADVLLYDSLTLSKLIETVPDSVDTIDVGKKPGPDGERTTQVEINQQMVDRAVAGDSVVRLKGGDPTVFGRGGEEAEYLAECEIPFEFVPGVSSFLSTGLVGIPLTHREHASTVTVITGHEDPEKAESSLDWDALANTVSAGGTLVVLMGVRRLPEYTASLQKRGVGSDTPVAMIQKATWEDEATVTGTIETIVERRDDAGIEPPALTVIGDVVSVRGTIHEWLQRDEAVDVGIQPPFATLPDPLEIVNGSQ